MLQIDLLFCIMCLTMMSKLIDRIQNTTYFYSNRVLSHTSFNSIILDHFRVTTKCPSISELIHVQRFQWFEVLLRSNRLHQLIWWPIPYKLLFHYVHISFWAFRFISIIPEKFVTLRSFVLIIREVNIEKCTWNSWHTMIISTNVMGFLFYQENKSWSYLCM